MFPQSKRIGTDEEYDEQEETLAWESYWKALEKKKEQDDAISNS